MQPGNGECAAKGAVEAVISSEEGGQAYTDAQQEVVFRVRFPDEGRQHADQKDRQRDIEELVPWKHPEDKNERAGQQKGQPPCWRCPGIGLIQQAEGYCQSHSLEDGDDSAQLHDPFLPP